MAKIGIITFSDGRKNVHEELKKMNQSFQDRLRKRLEKDGHEVVTARDIVWTNALAANEGKYLAESGCDCTIFNFAIWSFPHLPAIASQFVPKPILQFSNINPQYPGLVGMLASAGALNQLGVKYYRQWGEIEDEVVYAKVKSFINAAACVKKLKGETYGYFGGRPMGMYTAVSNCDQWMRVFGVDIEHIDQWEIVRLSEEVPDSKAEKAVRWIEEMGGHIHYDGKQLTPEIFKRQIKSYYAVKRMCEEMRLDFCGIKGQPELTNNFCTMDVTEAFMNDPYDWDGPKEPTVCSTEADSDAALTMEIFKHLAKTPVLFADVRHYHEDLDVFDFCNSGEHATYFAGKSFDPKVNLPHVHFYPESFYFPAGGASVAHLTAPGEATFARLTRLGGQYWMAIIHGEFVQFDEKKNQELMKATQEEWPHAFAKLCCTGEEFLLNYASNHIHAVYGNYVDDLMKVCEMLDIEAVVFGSCDH